MQRQPMQASRPYTWAQVLNLQTRGLYSASLRFSCLSTVIDVAGMHSGTTLDCERPASIERTPMLLHAGAYSGSPAIASAGFDVQLRGLAPAQLTVIDCQGQLLGGFELGSNQTNATVLQGDSATCCRALHAVVSMEQLMTLCPGQGQRLTLCRFCRLLYDGLQREFWRRDTRHGRRATAAEPHIYPQLSLPGRRCGIRPAWQRLRRSGYRGLLLCWQQCHASGWRPQHTAGVLQRA